MQSAKTIQIDKRVCVSDTATCLDLGQVILTVTTILTTHTAEDNTPTSVVSHRIKYNKY